MGCSRCLTEYIHKLAPNPEMQWLGSPSQWMATPQMRNTMVRLKRATPAVARLGARGFPRAGRCPAQSSTRDYTGDLLAIRCPNRVELPNFFRTLPRRHRRRPIVYRTDPNFEFFDEDVDDCNGPIWEYDAGIALLVLYMVIMAILMLNLLIAVLSTVHDAVNDHSELEFQLSRNQIIQRQTYEVQKDRLPPPFSLVLETTLVAADVVGELWNVARVLCAKRPNAPHESANIAPTSGGGDGGGPADILGGAGQLRRE